MDDLEVFCAREDLPAIAQAAIAHAQFETIHPFLDGNGRVGRCLIHMVMRHRGMVGHLVPPVSQILAANGKTYVGGLTLFREGRVAEWCEIFSRAMETACERTGALGAVLDELQEGWTRRLPPTRADASVRQVLAILPSVPILGVDSAAALIGRDRSAVAPALEQLERLKILTPLREGARRGRAWAAREVFGVLDEFEWNLVTPSDREAPRVPDSCLIR